MSECCALGGSRLSSLLVSLLIFLPLYTTAILLMDLPHVFSSIRLLLRSERPFSGGGEGIDNREDIFFSDLVMQQGKQAKKKKTDLRIYSTLLLTLPNEHSSYPHLLQIPAIAQACKGRKDPSFVRRFFFFFFSFPRPEPNVPTRPFPFPFLTCSSVV